MQNAVNVELLNSNLVFEKPIEGYWGECLNVSNVQSFTKANVGCTFPSI